ncbi:MAG: DNA strand exchange inhibitor protein [Gemmataceae bacterium]|jgi:DNA mismatch repair protein MutS2|uniref:DNA strand exchange inhibitor protein n=1 Tax=Thermogemmata fonticola TaxID=2755323 RepID=A0A7V9AAS1_9BACT|nr:DNA strand exchange inhibitor protein [Thermogemmata fonticola]MBA2225303.1 DNA strand exchange inhibitor protein [Thermogemmata fonticola]MCX8139614.1 DNA strand exchange inhibitor protein [Gemmataceae bacterium]
MDAHTLELLGYEAIRELLASYATTSLGRELARRLEPSTDLAHIQRQIAWTSEMVEALAAGVAPPLQGIHDIRLWVRRAALGTMLAAEQLVQIAETLQATGALYRYRMRLPPSCKGLMELLAGIEDFGPTARLITACIDARGHVLDMASPELADIRRRLHDLDERIKGEIRRMLRDPELRRLLSYPNATVHGDHHVLPVAVNYRHKVAGVVHRMSATGETVFIEPASVAALHAERVALQAAEEREVQRVLRRLSGEVGRLAKPLGYALDIAARLDLITAQARFSRDYRMSAPQLNTEGRLWLQQARHPLLEHLFRTSTEEQAPRQVVPIDVRLGFHFNILIITGPNTGGKTVALKTTGLLCLMAQSGLHVPAAPGSLLPVFRHILADIGDEQSLEQSLSTFSAHMSRIATILRTATADSLVLLDELGAGTDPTEGAALGRAILDQLDQIGCRAMVTTHLGDLKTYAFSNPRAENGAVEFDVETLRPTYRLHIGQFGMSNALTIARRLQLPPELLQRAARYLHQGGSVAAELARLQRVRQEAEQAKAEAVAARLAAEQEKQAYAQRRAHLEQQAAEQAQLQEWRSRLREGETVRVSRFDAVGRVVRVDLRKRLITVHIGLGQWEVPFEEILPVTS